MVDVGARSKILSLTPCTEAWWAGFIGPVLNGHQSSGYRFARVAAWALCERPSGDVEVSPVCRCFPGDDRLALACDDNEFLGVIEPGEDHKVWMTRQDTLRGLYERAETRARALLTGPGGRGGLRR